MATKHGESQQTSNSPLSQTRRSALKKMLVGTGMTAGVAALPSKWVKPVMDKVLVPAHAQTSRCSVLSVDGISGDCDLASPINHCYVINDNGDCPVIELASGSCPEGSSIALNMRIFMNSLEGTVASSPAPSDIDSLTASCDPGAPPTPPTSIDVNINTTSLGGAPYFVEGQISWDGTTMTISTLMVTAL